LLRRTLGSRGRKGEEEGATYGFCLRRGCTISLWEDFLRGGGYYKGKAKASKSSKVKQEKRQSKGIRIKTKASKGRKAHQGKGRLTSQGLWGGLQGTPRHSRVVVIVPGSLVYVSCVVHFALRPSIYTTLS
jgi:hypothetical protein